MGNPWRIVRRNGLRVTRDGRYRIGARFGLLWAAWRRCACENAKPRWCYCDPIRLPGGVAGTGFHTLKAIEAALERKYRRHGWS